MKNLIKKIKWYYNSEFDKEIELDINIPVEVVVLAVVGLILFIAWLVL